MSLFRTRWLCDGCYTAVSGLLACCADGCAQHLDHNGACHPGEHAGQTCDRCGVADRLTEHTEEHPPVLHPVFTVPGPAEVELLAHVELPGATDGLPHLYRLWLRPPHPSDVLGDMAGWVVDWEDAAGSSRFGWECRTQEEAAAEARRFARLEASLLTSGGEEA